MDIPQTGYPGAHYLREHLELMVSEALTEQVPRRRERAKAAKKQPKTLSRWDVVWEIEGIEGLRPGIPSFMAHTLQRYRKGRRPP